MTNKILYFLSAMPFKASKPDNKNTLISNCNIARKAQQTMGDGGLWVAYRKEQSIRKA